MYKSYFGLKSEPFAMTPDPGMLHITVAQREALAGITYGILTRRGFVALIGDAGTGKTTLLNKVMEILKQGKAQFSVIYNPILTAAEFLESALADFGVNDIPVSKAQRLVLLHELLLSADRRRVTSVLIVDEAHKLSPEVLEEIRLLSNFERPEGKLLQIILAGQPQLSGILDRAELEQLKQRVAVRVRIGRFSPAELKAYIAQRWKTAGGGEPPFTVPAIERIIAYSRGIPRVVNAVCDNALMLAMAEGVLTVTHLHVEEAARDLALIEAPAVKAAANRPTVETAPRTAEPASSPRPAAGVQPKPAPSTTVIQEDDGPLAIPILERYANGSANKSVLSRLLGKLGLA